MRTRRSRNATVYRLPSAHSNTLSGSLGREPAAEQLASGRSAAIRKGADLFATSWVGS